MPLEAVEAVWADGDVVDPLSVLVDHSLVRRTTGYRDEPRFGMLALVREHAARVAEDGPGRRPGGPRGVLLVLPRRPLRAALDRRDLPVARRHQRDARRRCARPTPGRRAAGDLPLTARITAALGAYWFLEGHHAEGLRWIDEMLAVEDELDPYVSARIHLAAGFMAFPSSRPEARAHWERATELFRTLGETRLRRLRPRGHVGDLHRRRRGPRVGDADQRRGAGAGPRVGSPALVAQVLNIRGELTRVAGRDELAREAYEEGLQISGDLGDEMYVSVFLSNLSYLADHRGDHEEARRLTHQALRICWSQGRRLMAAWTISQLAGPEHALGRSELGAVLIGAGDEALRVLGARRHPGDVPEHDRVVAGDPGGLGDERFEELRAEGARPDPRPGPGPRPRRGRRSAGHVRPKTRLTRPALRTSMNGGGG